MAYEYRCSVCGYYHPLEVESWVRNRPAETVGRCPRDGVPVHTFWGSASSWRSALASDQVLEVPA